MPRAGSCALALSAAPSVARAAKPGVGARPQVGRPPLGVATRAPAGIVHRALRSDQTQAVDDTKMVQVIAEVMSAVEAETQSIGAGISDRIALTREARYVTWRMVFRRCVLFCVEEWGCVARSNVNAHPPTPPTPV